MPNNIADFLKSIKIQANDMSLYEIAFRHASYTHEKNLPSLESNQRLEFLGDAVLELVVTEHLYEKVYKDEGELTSLRSALVKGSHLAEVANKIQLNNCILLSAGEKSSQGEFKDYILANVMESLIGAIFLDKGLEKARRFILDYITPSLEKIMSTKSHISAKTRFQEEAQSQENTTPVYKLEKEAGPEHSKNFHKGVYLNEQLIATGSGSSKQKAEQDAARKALIIKGW